MLVASSSISSGELGGHGYGARALPEAAESQAAETDLQHGFTSHLPTILGNGGEAIKEAADAMLDKHWGRAWRRLEVASLTCQEYWPSSSFEGLVNMVFCHAEAVPNLKGRAASASLERLADGLDEAIRRIDANNELRYPYKERAVLVLMNAADVLRETVELFEASSFYTPPDPRGQQAAEEKDVHGWYDDDLDEDSDTEFGGPFPGAGRRAQAGHPGPPDEDITSEYEQRGVFAAARISQIKEELERANAEGPRGRQRVLRRLVRECHPDQNPGQEAEILPVFEYVLKILRVSNRGSAKASP